LGKVNFVLRDRRDRLWITISTQINPWSEAINSRLADGYIVLLDERGPRVVADGSGSHRQAVGGPPVERIRSDLGQFDSGLHEDCRSE
jgi:hypothetical protein